VVTRGDFEEYLKNLPPQMQERARTPEGAREFLDTLVDRELLYQKARTEGLDKNPEIKMKVEMFRQKLMAQELIKSKITPPGAAEAEARQYYEAHPEEYGGGAMVKAQQILVSWKQKDARSRAQEVLKRLRSGKEDFAGLAKKYSDDAGTASRGGDMGWVIPGVINPALEKAVFALNKGQISDPIETDLGIHLLKAGEKQVRPAKPYELVRDEIQKKLAPIGARGAFDQYLAELKKEIKVKIKEKNLEALIQNKSK
jgi:peptidyl-prolyl cis-trans isomerase C